MGLYTACQLIYMNICKIIQKILQTHAKSFEDKMEEGVAIHSGLWKVTAKQVTINADLKFGSEFQK